MKKGRKEEIKLNAYAAMKRSENQGSRSIKEKVNIERRIEPRRKKKQKRTTNRIKNKKYCYKSVVHTYSYSPVYNQLAATQTRVRHYSLLPIGTFPHIFADLLLGLNHPKNNELFLMLWSRE